MSSHYDKSMATKPFLPYKMGYLTDWMIKKAKKELNEAEENRGPALEEFRKLIAEDTKLNCWTDDAYLLQFLRARKFNVKSAMNRLQHFNTVKKNFPEIFPHNLDLDTFRRAFDTGGAGCLPYRDENGAAVVIFKIAKWDPDLFTIGTAISFMIASALCAIEDPATQVCGMQLIFDLKGANFKQIRQVSPRYFQLVSYGLKHTVPIRFTGIHAFNESFFLVYLWSVFKLFLTEKIRNRIHFHGSDTKSLQKYIPKEILPPEYDGDNIRYDAKEWCRTEMEPFCERYAEMHRKGYC